MKFHPISSIKIEPKVDGKFFKSLSWKFKIKENMKDI